MGDGRDPDDADNASTLVAKKREFLESFFKKGAEFTRELLRENDRLRRQLLQLEDQLAARGRPEPSQSTLDELLAKLHALEEEKRQLLDRLEEIDETGGRFASRYQEIEAENNDLASLFVAQGQLYASLDVREVVQVMIEILLNFVGAQRFAILLADSAGALRVLATEGIDPDTLGAIVPGDGSGVIAEVAARATLEVNDAAPALRRDPAADDPTVCFSLSVGGRTVGVIALWCFLPQKESLEELDRRIFELLWMGGGRALEAARLASLARGIEVPVASGPHGTYEQYAALMA